MKQLVWIDTETQVVVPREPTGAMLVAGGKERGWGVYSAMLAAAPEMQGVELPEPMDDSQPRGYPTIESSYAEGFNAYRDAIIRSAK